MPFTPSDSTEAPLRAGHRLSAGRRSGSPWPARIIRAIVRGRIALALQPVVLARAPDRIAFHEALVRLVADDGRVISAGAFIDAVEPTPAGRILDRAALRLAIAELAAVPHLRLSVNLSPHGIADREWSAILSAAVDAHPTLAERLIIEITERGLGADLSGTGAFLGHWRTRGVAFALDDFGAGTTAYRHLRDFRFDIVKLDGSFSRAVDRDPDQQAFLRTLIPLARHFEAMTVAEAVEGPAEAAVLAALGVDALQGHHFGAPVLGRPPAALPTGTACAIPA